MNVPLPRRTIHHGVVLAHGLWFSGGVASTQQRVLSVWEPGAQVFSLGESYIVRFHAPRQVAVAASVGAPLTLEGNTLTSAPLRASERARLSEGAWLILIEAGVPRAFEAHDWQVIDPADWLDLAEFQPLELAPVESLGEPPLKLDSRADPQTEIAQRIQRTEEHRHEQAELLAALSKGPAELTAGAKLVRPNRVASGLMRGLLAVLRFVLGLRKTPSAAARTVPRPAPGILQRLEARIARWIARSRLMTLLAQRQAAYLRGLLDALEAHDDMEVLRRAIPLGDGQSKHAPPALSAPSLRTEFRISLSARPRTSLIGLGGTLFSDLRRAYEAVLDRLTRSGKHEEAAFFLAEILKDPERAVDYLERHGRLLLAAQLAEARQLSPGLVVRQWFLAGEQDRALAIAVREGAFADAILRLERSGKTKQADALRLLQADRLASAGRWLAAARLVSARPGGALLALRWLELLRQAGDVRGLALELSLDPQRFESVRVALEPLLTLSTRQAAEQRVLVASELRQLDVLAGMPLARELTREILADAAAFADRSFQQTASTIAHWLGGAFHADFPSELPAPGGLAASLPEHHHSPVRLAGSRPIFDVCECASRFVVALGEAGVLVVNREGKRVAHFDTPAERLVVSEDGTRLLALAKRGDAYRVSQIDLATRRSRVWGELRADVFATTFDGQTWVIGRVAPLPLDDSELLVLDVFDDSPSVLRRLPVSGRLNVASGIQIDDGNCSVFASAAQLDSGVERVRFELPSWTLRERTPVRLGAETGQHVFSGSFAAVASGPLAICSRFHPAADGSNVPLTVRREHLQISLPGEPPAANDALRFQVTAGAFAVSLDQQAAARVIIGSFGATQVLSLVELEGAHTTSVRLSPTHALLCDDVGRLLSFDLSSGRCVHDLRL